MLRRIDALLNNITMYKLVFYELIGLLLAAGFLGAFGLVSVSPLYLAYSAAFIFIIAWAVNKLFAWVFDAPSNPESTYITALILALIISPPHAFMDMAYFALAGWAAAWAAASKYIFAIGKKHLFNPAAFGVAVPALFLLGGAGWWVGTPWMLPFTLAGGFLIVRKLRRMDLVIAFGVAFALTVIAATGGGGLLNLARIVILSTPLIFLATVMLTEPLTTPPTRFYIILYGALVGFLSAPQVHFGSFYLSPELALLAGNLFSYAASPKTKLVLTLTDRVKLADGSYEFVFAAPRRLAFSAGQYLEWTLAHPKADGRGIRRYFTIASAPEDAELRLGVKFSDKASTFKKALFAMKKGGTLVASQLAGDFTLPAAKKQKLAFIAGGIGVTPFASMLRHLLATGEKRDIVVLYANRTMADLAYGDLLGQAERELGIPTIPVFTEQESLTSSLIRSELPDYRERTFYLSGPRSMVIAYSDLLLSMGVPRLHVKEDFFPGFT